MPAITVPAQLSMARGVFTTVRIVDLTAHACKLSERLHVSLAGIRGVVWIGAIGPLHVLNRAGLDRLDFDGPLHPSIVAHFNA